MIHHLMNANLMVLPKKLRWLPPLSSFAKGSSLSAKSSFEKAFPGQEKNPCQSQKIVLRGINDGYLKSKYHMSKDSLFKLHSLLQQNLDRSKKRKRDDSIMLLAKVMIGLQYLAGSRWVDIAHIHRVSRESVFVCVQQFTFMVAPSIHLWGSQKAFDRRK
jgi:fatty-acid desaturase